MEHTYERYFFYALLLFLCLALLMNKSGLKLVRKIQNVGLSFNFEGKNGNNAINTAVKSIELQSTINSCRQMIKKKKLTLLYFIIGFIPTRDFLESNLEVLEELLVKLSTNQQLDSHIISRVKKHSLIIRPDSEVSINKVLLWLVLLMQVGWLVIFGITSFWVPFWITQAFLILETYSFVKFWQGIRFYLLQVVPSVAICLLLPTKQWLSMALFTMFYQHILVDYLSGTFKRRLLLG